MVQTIQHRRSNDRTRCGERILVFNPVRYVLLNTLMGSSLVVIINVLANNAVQLETIQGQHIVQTIPFQATDEAFTNGIGAWRSFGGLDGFDAGMLDEPGKQRPELLVSIVDEVFGVLVPRGGFSQLLGDPFIGGGAGNSGDNDDAAGVEFDDDKDVDGSEQEIMHHSEVTGPDVVGVVFQESTPGLTGGGGWSELVEVFLDGAFADLKAKFEQFTTDAFRTPQPVFLRHLFDEIDDLLCDAGFAVFLASLEAPVEAEKITMPAQQGIGLDNVERLLPELSTASQPQQAEAVTVGQSGTFDLTVEDDELLAEHGVFGDEVGSAAGHIYQRSDDEGRGGWFGPLSDPVAEVFAEFEKMSDHAGMASQYPIDCSA